MSDDKIKCVGHAIQIQRKKVAIGDYETMCGYYDGSESKEDKVADGSDALVSFLLRTGIRPNTIEEFTIDGRMATVVSFKKSQYIDSMYKFQVKWKEV